MSRRRKVTRDVSADVNADRAERIAAEAYIWISTVGLIGWRRELNGQRQASIARHLARRLGSELVRACSSTCTPSGCRNLAVGCDLDHTVPYDEHGLTCECNLGPESWS